MDGTLQYALKTSNPFDILHEIEIDKSSELSFEENVDLKYMESVDISLNDHIHDFQSMNNSSDAITYVATQPLHHTSYEHKNDDVKNSKPYDFIMITKTFLHVTGMMMYLSVLSFIQVEDGETMMLSCSCDKGDTTLVGDPKKFRRSFAKNLITCHLNVNGFRNKFTEISEICTNGLSDVLFLSETKVDASFPTAQFAVTGYKCLRADRNSKGGGILAYIRSDLGHRRRTDIEALVLSSIESLIIEIIVRGEKWIFICLYNPHNRTKGVCCESIQNVLQTCESENFAMINVMGDMNVNLLQANEAKCLIDMMEITGLNNIIKDPTCFK